MLREKGGRVEEMKSVRRVGVRNLSSILTLMQTHGTVFSWG